MSQLLKSSGAMGFATLTSRILGMVREIVYARFMGDSWVAGAFMFAFTVPNLFRRLLGEGALTAAFVPIFKEKEKNAGEAEMWRVGNVVVSGLLIAAGMIVILVMAGVSVALDAGKFQDETRLMLELLRMMFPYMLLVCLAAVFISMANARGHFFIPAMGAAMLNIVMILSVLLLAPRMGTTLEKQIFGLAIGVLVAGIVQCVFQLPTLYREGYRFCWIQPWNDPVIKIIIQRMIPGTIGVAAYQINMLVTQSIAFGVSPSIVAAFNYAVRLMELPQGVFGISIATYLLTTLSGLAAEKNYKDFRATLREGIENMIFVNLIASVLLTFLAEPIVRLLFERGAFTAASTHRVAIALMFLAPGLIAFSSINILARSFFAMGDTRTPMKISVFCLMLNIIFTALLVKPLEQAGMALANTCSGFINVYLLNFAIKRRLGGEGFDGLQKHILRLLIIAVASGGVALAVYQGWAKYIGHSNLIQRIGEVFVPITIATSIYFWISILLKVKVARDILNLVISKFSRLNH